MLRGVVALPFLPPFLPSFLPSVHSFYVLAIGRKYYVRSKPEMVSRPRRTFRSDENNYALSSLSSSMCAKLCSLGSTWPGKGSLVAAGMVTAEEEAAARSNARPSAGGRRASQRGN